ncbi:MAG TPA: EAL domain-containing protein [Gallionellaceae bacterium]|nr:EAL domain-containing protein [Gallionellaceae bacterium]
MVENRLEVTAHYYQRLRWFIVLLCTFMLAAVLASELGWMHVFGELETSAGEGAQQLVAALGGWSQLNTWERAALWVILPALALAGIYLIHCLLIRLSSTYARSHVILQSIGEAVVVTDAGGRTEYLNIPAQKLLGWTQQQAQGKPLAELLQLIQADTRKPLANPVERVRAEGRVEEHNALLLTTDGRELAIEDSVAPVCDERGNLNGVVMVFRDISAQKNTQRQIEELVYHDHLTGLPNRRLLHDHVDKAISSARLRHERLALLLVDLDHFKVINDTLGHEMGDHILLIAGGRLISCVREQDTIARVGGDEFVVMLAPIRDAGEAASMAQKIGAALSFPYQVNGADLHSTPSIGISMYPDDGEDFGMLMKHADAAMYHAKGNGRAAYRFYTQAMHERSLERLTIENNLHKALQNGEFELHYQPKVNMREGTLVGAEALIRWNHPELGMISPGKFIPIAEESGIINAIGEWVLYGAGRQSRIWSDAGLLVLPVSVNVSARQLLYGDLPNLLQQVIRDTGAHPSMLELELTESVLMRPQEVEETLQACKAMGFKIALDDFGTGYSSLSYLRRMAIDTLKIDRSFVAEMEHNQDDVAIVQTIISMARNLRMNVIAEGVETAAQVELLKQSGCDYCQGYYFSKPQPLEEFSALLYRSARRAEQAAIALPKTTVWPGQAQLLSGARRHRYLL